MKISFCGFTFAERQLVKQVFNKAVKILTQPKNIAVTLAFTDENEIKQLNNTFRQTDKLTDVLSFPASQMTAGDIAEEKTFVGDIAICRAVMQSQAKEYGHSVKRELAFLALHGFLHLLGFDHQTEQQEKTMQQTAEAILDACKIER